MTYPIDMGPLYMAHADQRFVPTVSFTNVPDLISCAYDDDTDPSPSPPVVSLPEYRDASPYHPPNQASQNHSHQFNAYQYSAQPQPHVMNSVEFTHLPHCQADEQARRQRSSQPSRPSPSLRQSACSATTTTTTTTTQESKEAASNMRIRRRAQNRASQRAFRERKEKHVQHLEHELELLDATHQHLAKSYSELDSRHAEAQNELMQLRSQLALLRSTTTTTAAARDGSGCSSTVVAAGMATSSSGGGSQKIKREPTNNYFVDPFATDAYFGSGTMSDIKF